MLSETHAESREPGARLEAATRLAATQFGLDLAKFPAAQVNALLSALPEEISPHHEPAVARLLSVCSVGETMFMRHPEQLAALARIVQEGRVGAPDRPLVLWSAGCATGEEAYSLAALFQGHPGGVRVLGTDVSERAVTRAQAGHYSLWSMRGMDPDAASGFLDVDACGVRVREPLKRLVAFRVHNLQTDEYPRDVDVVVCRNVLLYFRNDAAAAVIRRFHETLRPGGVLLLGYVDPQSDAEPFVEAYEGAVRYHRKGLPGELRVPGNPSPPPPPARAPPMPRELSPLPAPGPSSRAATLLEDLAHVRALAGCGAREEALERLVELCQSRPLEVELHVLAAMIADEAGLGERALEASRRAYFLAPESPVTIFLLATCLEHVGEGQKAALRFVEASRVLERFHGSAGPLAFGQGMTTSELRRAIDARTRGT